jgi:threonine synthase
MNYQNNQLSMGEGDTPLIRLINLEKYFDWQGQIWAKAEYLNPTGSFKDRGTIGEINAALKLNKSGLVCASTGNMAASLAAYAAKILLPCYVVVPKSTPEGKLRLAQMCRAKIIRIDGVYDNCVQKAEQLAIDKNYYLCGDYKIRRIGQTSIGSELANSKIKFDAFICPVGNGTVGCAICAGFASEKLSPKFIGVQGEGADSIYQAWIKGSSIVRTIELPSTVASAMNVGKPLDGKLTLKWIKRTSGEMVSVTNDEIILAQSLLAKLEGIYVEKASAATVAALRCIDTSKWTVVLILTGNGLKENF